MFLSACRCMEPCSPAPVAQTNPEPREAPESETSPPRTADRTTQLLRSRTLLSTLEMCGAAKIPKLQETLTNRDVGGAGAEGYHDELS